MSETVQGSSVGRLAVVVLAAGAGTRMRSRLPKVLHRAAGRTLVEHVLRATAAVSPEATLVVVRHEAAQVRAALAHTGVRCVDQGERDGTGAAVLAARPVLEGSADTVLVVNGDAPLVTGESLTRLLRAHLAGGAGMSMLTYEVDDASGLGRVVRASDGSVAAIVEERDADADTLRLREVNPGTYLFDASLWRLLEGVGNDNAAGEYYLTDVIAAYRRAGLPVRAVLGDDETRALVGVNDRAQLARAEALLRDRTRARWLDAGVTMLHPDSTVIDDEARLARDVVLWPGVLLLGATALGEGAEVGAYTVLRDCLVEAGASVPPHTVASGRSFSAADHAPEPR